MDALDAVDNYSLPSAHPPETQRLIHDEARRVMSRPALVCAVCNVCKSLDEVATEYGPNAGAVWHYYDPDVLLKEYREELSAPPLAPPLDADIIKYYEVPEVRGPCI